LIGELDNYQHGNIQHSIRIKQEPPDMYMGQQYGNQPGPSNSQYNPRLQQQQQSMMMQQQSPQGPYNTGIGFWVRFIYFFKLGDYF